MKSIKNGWKIILKKAETGERPLHRNREFEREKRIEDKENKPHNWYKQNGQFESLMVIPATPGSILKKIFEEKAKLAGLKIKIVERSGMKLVNYLKKFDKTNKKEQCGKKDCLICKYSDKANTKCRIPNIVYKISCKECEKEKVKANYYGETSFNGYTRGLQHFEKYRSKNKGVQEKSALRIHAKEVHDDKKVEFKMEIVKTFKNKPLSRQVYESIQIIKSKNEDKYPMNGKEEFNQALIVSAKYSKGVI